jgi:hypothetical protein
MFFPSQQQRSTMNTPPLIEPLEQRVAPAAITINSALKTATWTDFDGDLVTLKYSSAVAPAFAKTDNGLGLIVDKITLNANDHTNAAFSLTVKAAAGGDGRVDLGRIAATDIPLKSWIAPKATLVEIDCGDGNKAIDTFISGSIGAVPSANFNNTGGDDDSFIQGAVKTFKVQGDIAAAGVSIQVANGKIGAVTVTGSLRGDAPGTSAYRGYLAVSGNSIASIFIGGSIVGGDSPSAGRLATANGPTGKVTVLGDIVGGTESLTGHLYVDDPKSAFIRGNVIGGSNEDSGVAAFGGAGTVTIGGSVVGGSMQRTGYVFAQSAVSLTVKGSIFGGMETAATDNQPTGVVQVTGSLKTFVLGGNLVGGSFGSGTPLSYNGAVLVQGNLGSATIKGSILGHDGAEAIIMAGGIAPATPGNYNAIGKLTVGGSVSFAYIAAGHTINSFGTAKRIDVAENPDAGIGSVTVGGDWIHSSLTAGINDIDTNGAQSTDTRDAGDAARLAVLGPVVIKGGILDNPNALDFSGFLAERIASITAGGVKLFKTGDPAKSLDRFGYVDVAEI